MKEEDKDKEERVVVRRTVYRRTLLGAIIALPCAVLSALGSLGDPPHEEEVVVRKKRSDYDDD